MTRPTLAINRGRIDIFCPAPAVIHDEDDRDLVNMTFAVFYCPICKRHNQNEFPAPRHKIDRVRCKHCGVEFGIDDENTIYPRKNVFYPPYPSSVLGYNDD